jgi:hypothetical protein
VVGLAAAAALRGAHEAVWSGSVGYLRASAAGIPFLYLSYAPVDLPATTSSRGRVEPDPGCTTSS